MGAGTIKTGKQVLYKLNIQKPHGPTIPHLDVDPKKIRIHNDPRTPLFRAAQLTMAKN